MAFFDSLNNQTGSSLMKQDTVLTQFLGLRLGNQPSNFNDKIDSFSSSPSFGSYLFDPIGVPLNIGSERKLKARSRGDDFTFKNALPSIVTSSHDGGKRRANRGSSTECVFCKNNGQPFSFYQSHTLKDTLGRVVCPILQAYNCPICQNGGGPTAHTVRYCPENKPSARLKSSTLNIRDKANLLAPQDTLLTQFLELCLDNRQAISNKINSFSSSSSYGSHGLIDPIGTPLNNPGSESIRKLKARQENSIQQFPLNIPAAPVPNHNSGKKKSRRGSCIECVFCKNNGKPVSFYQSHVLKDTLGRVVCPILFAYDCPICHNGGGPQAHTIRYCPDNKPSNRLRNALLKSQALLNSDQSIL